MKIHIAMALVLVTGTSALAQNSLPDPFGPPQRHWATLPDGKPWGTTAGIEIGSHGEIWAIDRCGEIGRAHV